MKNRGKRKFKRKLILRINSQFNMFVNRTNWILQELFENDTFSIQGEKLWEKLFKRWITSSDDCGTACCFLLLLCSDVMFCD